MLPHEMLAQGWRCLPCSKTLLDISFVLCSGQSFRWKEKDGCWTGIHKRRVWSLRQDDNQIWYKVLNQAEVQNADGDIKKAGGKRKKGYGLHKKGAKAQKLEDNIDGNCNLYPKDEMSKKEILEDYFQLGVDLDTLCDHWCKVDEHFGAIKKVFPGVRMLRQDPVENLFSFICSSNNNITRISSMVEKMCTTFGEKIHCDKNGEYFAFPDVERLAQSNTEEILRNLGFGYRAKYIYHSAVQIHKNGGKFWLDHLRSLPYEKAHPELVKLTGIGAKVADCICMMSLDKTQAIPVDTHVWQIATRDYNITQLKCTKTLSASSYKAIGDFFRDLWGDYASWAMNFLFVADLKQFKQQKEKIQPEKIQLKPGTSIVMSNGKN